LKNLSVLSQTGCILRWKLGMAKHDFLQKL